MREHMRNAYMVESLMNFEFQFSYTLADYRVFCFNTAWMSRLHLVDRLGLVMQYSCVLCITVQSLDSFHARM
jgi:hypothetical protein